jgi:hypothetical protein
MDGYSHYIRLDANNIIIYRFSDAFETPLQTDICVATDADRHYNDPYTNERGQFIFKWENGSMVSRTQSELDVEWNNRPPQPPSTEDRLAAAESALLSIMGL